MVLAAEERPVMSSQHDVVGHFQKRYVEGQVVVW